MKSFLLKCLLFFVLFFALDKLLILYRNSLPAKELDRRLEVILNGKMDADVIVMGSSRGARDIVASQLADSFKTSAFNLSYPGSNIFFHEYLLEELLKNKNRKPRLLVLAVDDSSEVEENASIKFRLDRLYPLVKYESVRNTLIKEGEKNKVLSDLFIVHQLSISNFDLRPKKFGNQDTLLADGSMPISWQSPRFNKSFATRKATYNIAQENPRKLESFQHFIRLCRENNIRLLLACAPNFGTPTVGFTDRMKAIAGPGVELMQYDVNNPIYSNPDYYFDLGHLKLNGATIFTSEITNAIRAHGLL